jgi:hypothetical protein
VKKVEITLKEAQAICNILMVIDGPLYEEVKEEHIQLERVMNDVAKRFGFDSWVVLYHYPEVPEEEK